MPYLIGLLSPGTFQDLVQFLMILRWLDLSVNIKLNLLINQVPKEDNRPLSDPKIKISSLNLRERLIKHKI